MEKTLAEAGKLASLPKVSRKETKRLVLVPHIDVVQQAFRAENKIIASLQDGPANREAVRALLVQ